jgi:hypothetical protein
VSSVAVEISDAGIVVAADSGDGGTETAGPGYALIDGGSLLTGSAALAAARLRPRQVDNRFWSELDTTPLPGPFRGELTRADLAHAHLAAVWAGRGSEVETAILALPGTGTEEQLGLAVGIARACDIPVKGVVDSAVASAASGSPAGSLLHVDLQLHRAVVTEMVRGNEIVRRQAQVGDGVGLVALHEAWVKRIAEIFVRSTRFDPLHAASTEQALFDRLPQVLQLLRDDETAHLELESGSGLQAVDLAKDDLLAAVHGLYEAVVQLVRQLKRSGEAATLLLTRRVHDLPGLAERLAEVGDTSLLPLPAGAAVAGALRMQHAIRTDEEALPFVTRLPVAEVGADPPAIRPPSVGPRAPRRRAGALPTHLLLGEVAHPIGPRPLILGVRPSGEGRRLKLTGVTSGISRSHCNVRVDGDSVVLEDHSSHGSFVNGQRVDGRLALVAGDRLRLGTPGIEMLLIHTVPDDG